MSFQSRCQTACSFLTSSWGGHVADVNQCKLPRVMNSVIHLSTASNAKACLCTQAHQYLGQPPMLMYASAHNHVRTNLYLWGWYMPVHTKAHQYNFRMHAVGRSCKALTPLPMSGSVSQHKRNGLCTTGNVHLQFINSRKASLVQAWQKQGRFAA